MRDGRSVVERQLAPPFPDDGGDRPLPILGRDDATGTVNRVLVEGTDELGREFHAEGETVSRFVNFCNENLVGWNYLVRWDIDGVEAWGEQHENYSPVAFRKYLRSRSNPAALLA